MLTYAHVWFLLDFVTWYESGHTIRVHEYKFPQENFFLFYLFIY